MSCEPEKHKEGRFYGVYLLISESSEKRYKGKCYIGYTVNPNRRINQHNGITIGGARKTNNKGPWKMILIVHGFPNNISALQFEWAWQQPMNSSRLKYFTEIKRKNPKESYFQYNFRILSRMLNVGPWQRLPLIIRWIETDFKTEFEVDWLPPRHMQIVSGPITIAKEPKHKESQQTVLWATECHLCMNIIENPKRSRIACLNTMCKLTCHVICLANYIISSDLKNKGQYIPISGECPLCETELNWVALLHHKNKMENISSGIGEDTVDTDTDTEREELMELEEIENLEKFDSDATDDGGEPKFDQAVLQENGCEEENPDVEVIELSD